MRKGREREEAGSTYAVWTVVDLGSLPRALLAAFAEGSRSKDASFGGETSGGDGSRSSANGFCEETNRSEGNSGLPDIALDLLGMSTAVAGVGRVDVAWRIEVAALSRGEYDLGGFDAGRAIGSSSYLLPICTESRTA